MGVFCCSVLNKRGVRTRRVRASKKPSETKMPAFLFPRRRSESRLSEKAAAPRDPPEQDNTPEGYFFIGLTFRFYFAIFGD
jgi:hypothetical protein